LKRKGRKEGLFRHCERSEAIQRTTAASWVASPGESRGRNDDFFPLRSLRFKTFVSMIMGLLIILKRIDKYIFNSNMN
jgi:hypothetical protein